MAKRSTKVAVAYGTVNPVLYGADGVIDSTVSDNLVNFIFGKTNDGKGQDLKTKLSKSIVAENGSLTFVYDDSTGSGVVMKAGQLVSSKILDISTANKGENNGKTVTVSYLDTADKSTKTITFDTISASEVDKKIEKINQFAGDLSAVNTKLATIDSSIATINTNITDISTRLGDTSTRLNATSEKVTDVSTRVDSIESASYASSISKATNSPIVVNSAAGTAKGSKTYTIGVDVDNTTVKVANGKLTAACNTYKLEALGTPSDGYLKTYKLVETSASGAETSVGIIDIPKDQFLKSVHLCKANVAGNGAVSNEIVSGSAGFESSSDPVYLHFTWELKDGSDKEVQDTYLKVTDMAPVYSGDSSYISIRDYVVSFDASTFVEDHIGHKYVPAEGGTSAIEPTGIYKVIADNEKTTAEALASLNSSIANNTAATTTLENRITTLEKLDYSSSVEVKNTNTNYVTATVTIAEDASGRLTNTGSSFAINLATGNASYTAVSGDTPANLTASGTGLMTTDSIDDIKNYVDAVAAANQEALKVVVNGTGNTALAEVDSTDDHKLNLKTSALGDVNIVKDKSGNFSVSSTTHATSGFALAADVATEIIANANVVATALNDLNTRFKWVEI